MASVKFQKWGEMGNRLKAVGLFHSTAFPDDLEKKEMRDRTVIFLMKNGVDLVERPA